MGERQRIRGHDEEVHDFTSHSVSRCSRAHNLNITYTHSPSAHCSHIHTNATTSCTCSRESAHGVRVPCACASSRWCADGAPLQHVSMNSDDSNVDAPRHHRDRSVVAPFHRCRSCACVRASLFYSNRHQSTKTCFPQTQIASMRLDQYLNSTPFGR